ncbi:MAG: YbaN family protein [Prevotellaceae bacterium]|jgi:uncharacterized membrane protein YbaN (DUF454 family)|nr:YbaN family protein [Prevotellaceae bacterium]
MRYFLLAIGYVCILLGVIGIFLPIWPTVPFLLLASFIFYRCSPKAHRWLINHKVLGPYIRDFLATRTIPLRIKIISLSMMWGSTVFTLFFFLHNRWLQAGLVLGIILVTIHILSYKTKKGNNKPVNMPE